MKDKILDELVILLVAIVESGLSILPFILYHFLGVLAVVGWAIGILISKYIDKRKEFYSFED